MNDVCSSLKIYEDDVDDAIGDDNDEEIYAENDADKKEMMRVMTTNMMTLR